MSSEAGTVDPRPVDPRPVDPRPVEPRPFSGRVVLVTGAAGFIGSNFVRMLVRRGEPALDIDAEVAKLTAAQPVSTEHDPGIAEEVLQLVVARNERRERQGLEPLDIEAEVARTLAELNP